MSARASRIGAPLPPRDDAVEQLGESERCALEARDSNSRTRQQIQHTRRLVEPPRHVDIDARPIIFLNSRARVRNDSTVSECLPRGMVWIACPGPVPGVTDFVREALGGAGREQPAPIEDRDAIA